MLKTIDKKTGNVVKKGDVVFDFRGDAGTFDIATRAEEFGKSGKVVVSGRETYDRVWNLQVVEEEPTIVAEFLDDQEVSSGVKELVRRAYHMTYLNALGDALPTDIAQTWQQAVEVATSGRLSQQDIIEAVKQDNGL